MISNYEKQYIKIVENILNNGYFDNNRTGMPTYKIPHQVIQVDLQEEFPVLKSKFIAFKTAVKEMLWIYQLQSNNVKELQNQNVHIWDEWMKEDCTIGTSYGWIVKEFKQIDNLIHTLKTNPQDRRMLINLWQIPYLEGGSLHPCCFNTMWDVTDGKLNCMLIQRSGDIPLGVPFNTTQFAVLTHLLAQSTNLQVGKLTHVINNAHIYKNQIEGMKEQLERYKKLQMLKRSNRFTIDILKSIHNLNDDKIKELEIVLKSSPKLKLNKNITNFYDFTIDDIILDDYKHMGKIQMEVSV